jgi:hypothetical protein
MIMHQRAERTLVEHVQHFGQGRGLRLSRGEMLTVNLPQRPHERVPVLATDLTILVTVPLIQTRLLHFHSPIIAIRKRNAWSGRASLSRAFRVTGLALGKAPRAGFRPTLRVTTVDAHRRAGGELTVPVFLEGR